MKKSVLIGSPVHQEPAILAGFLNGIKQLEAENTEISYYFFYDNVLEASKQLLQEFAEGQTIISESGVKCGYTTNEITHFCNDALIWKVADMKDAILNYARKKNFDYVF